LCKCNHIPVNIEKLAQILQKDKLPILRYRRDDSLVDVVEWEAGISYAIISHVFADDFANARANSLRSCHLDTFVNVFEKITRVDQSLYFRDGSKELLAPIYFWIDALAIPVGDAHRELRKKAVKTMHLMYSRAAFTVVFDAGLMTQDRGNSYSETAMKITTSYWLTLLWTLQEACLSRRLFFVFHDALADMDQLEAGFVDDLVSPIPAAAQRYYYALLGPEREKVKRKIQLLKITDFLTSLWNALKWRKTSLSHHEPQAIATLLGLNMDSLEDVDFNPGGRLPHSQSRLEHKMRQLLDEIARNSDQAIPAGLIFLSGRKLSGKGYSWAPASWLACPGSEFHYLSESQLAGKLTPGGLEVMYPGFKLHKIAGLQPDCETFNEISFPSDCSLKEWFVARDEKFSDYIKPEVKHLAIITEEFPVKREPQLALIVNVLGRFAQTIRVQTLSTVTLRAEQDAHKILQLQRQLRNGLSQSFYGEVLNKAQVWCVDGSKTREILDLADDNQRGFLGAWGSTHLFSDLRSRFGFAR
jgi:hypothetical protein